ncbi:hypothetical protein GCM10010987_27960 [Bradyrhizobium guangdongense]|uniref:Uncharacterized protein n=1 Tax=Bradyrhizobium guangdongense TaxID=1325090 RepID=A0AA87W898_9BRAD|nr:hypothetical protein GCM10010987_27960 [Bradyrhizobium guangdongense]
MVGEAAIVLHTGVKRAKVKIVWRQVGRSEIDGVTESDGIFWTEKYNAVASGSGNSILLKSREGAYVEVQTCSLRCVRRKAKCESDGIKKETHDTPLRKGHSTFPPWLSQFA